MEYKNLTAQQKLAFMETLINRKKANKKSRFNTYFKNPIHFYIDCNCLVISAELYTREQATDILYNEYKYEYVAGDYDTDKDTKDFVDQKLGEIHLGYVIRTFDTEDLSSQWSLQFRIPNPLTNLHKPVYYLNI